MKKSYLTGAIALAMATATTPVFANGLALNEQSASGAGTSYAGRSSNPIDASTIYGNPAGLSRLTHTQASVGGTFIHANTDISHAQGAFGGSSDGDMVPDQKIPYAFFAQPLSDQVSWGIGIYAPFGVESDYENGFGGRMHGLNSKVQVITIQPTLSFKFNDRVAFGFGPTFSRIDGKLTNAIPGAGVAAVAQPLLQQLVASGQLPAAIAQKIGQGLMASPDVGIEVEGHDEAVGYNAGLLVAVTDNLDWGVTYHSKLSFHLDGHTNITNSPAVAKPLGIDLDGHYKASLGITMPESVDTSFTYRLNDWTLMAGATWTRWSRLESIDVQGMPSLLASRAKETLDWEDTLAWQLGAAYQLNDAIVLRTGLSGDPSPTSNEHRNVRIPVGNRHLASLGLGWTPLDNVTVDVAYQHLWEDQAGVNQQTYQAKYKNTADIISAGLTWRF